MGSTGRPPLEQWRGRAPAQAHLYGGLRAAPRDVAWGRGSAPGAPRKALLASLGRGRPSPAGHVETETSLRRGLLEPGITFGVTRTTREGGSRRAVGVMRKRLCKAAKQGKRLLVIRRHTKKCFQSPQHKHLAVLQLWSCGRGFALTCKVSDARRMPCAPILVGASHPVGLPHTADPAVHARIGCVKQ